LAHALVKALRLRKGVKPYAAKKALRLAKCDGGLEETKAHGAEARLLGERSQVPRRRLQVVDVDQRLSSVWLETSRVRRRAHHHEPLDLALALKRKSSVGEQSKPQSLFSPVPMPMLGEASAGAFGLQGRT